MTKKKKVEDPGITIAAIEVDDFRRLKLARVQVLPEVGLVRITGETAQGKTSLLKAVAAALFGAKAVDPGSIREDADSGRVSLRLSNDFIAERRFTRAASRPKGELNLVAPDMGPIKRAASILAEWVGPHAAAPLEFFQLDTAQQRDVLFSIAENPDLLKKVEGVRQKREATYSKRTPLISRRRQLTKVEKPEGERPEPIDTSSEMQKLTELRERQEERQEAHKDLEDARQGVRRAQLEVERLEKELAKAREELGSWEKAVDDAGAALEELEDHTEEIEALQGRIATASEVQKEIAPWERWDEAKSELDAIRKREEKLTTEIAELEKEEASLLEDAKIPVEGLSFNEEWEPLLNGRSFELASGRERIDAAYEVAVAARPQLKVILLDEANDLGLEDLKRLNERATQDGFQVLATRIGLEGEGEIVVDDGEAWGRDDPEGEEGEDAES